MQPLGLQLQLRALTGLQTLLLKKQVDAQAVGFDGLYAQVLLKDRRTHRHAGQPESGRGILRSSGTKTVKSVLRMAGDQALLNLSSWIDELESGRLVGRQLSVFVLHHQGYK